MNYLGGAMAALLLLSGCARAPIGPTQHESVHFDLDSSEVLRLNLKMGAGELHVNGGSKYLADADFSHNIASWKPLVSYHSTGSRGDLDITQPDGPSALGDVDYRWDVRLNDARQTVLVDSGYGLHATGLELDAIASVVIGGTLLAGGVGLVAGTLCGVLMLGLIQTLITFDGSLDRKSTRLNSSHTDISRMPSSA